METKQQKFDNIYKKNLWNDGIEGIPKSGTGSKVINSQGIIDLLDTSNDAESILDLACGDLTYMKACESVTSGALKYTGWDISQVIIDQIDVPWGSFECRDMTLAESYDADIVIFKDVAYHMSNEDILKVIEILKKSNFKYFLFNTRTGVDNSKRVLNEKHSWCDVDLLAEPFNLKPDLGKERYLDGTTKNIGAFYILSKSSLV